MGLKPTVTPLGVVPTQLPLRFTVWGDPETSETSIVLVEVSPCHIVIALGDAPTEKSNGPAVMPLTPQKSMWMLWAVLSPFVSSSYFIETAPPMTQLLGI
jgi:hypothetical protein